MKAKAKVHLLDPHALLNAMPDNLPWTEEAPAQPPLREEPVSALTAPSTTLRGQLTTLPALMAYIEAGKATLTVVSKKSGTRFTFKFTRPPENRHQMSRTTGRPIWVKLLSGPDNEGDFQFLGTIWTAPVYTFRISAKSRVKADAPSMRAIQWLASWVALGKDVDLFSLAEFWHEGRCGRCGRKLTVPSSIESGFGPECVRIKKA